MDGRIVVEDISRTRVDALRRVTVMKLHDQEARDVTNLEQQIAIELLRATPRFWSGAVVHTWRSPTQQICGRILCLDGYPAHATITHRLALPLRCLMGLFADIGLDVSDAMVGVAWTSPRTWHYQVRYWPDSPWPAEPKHEIGSAEWYLEAERSSLQG